MGTWDLVATLLLLLLCEIGLSYLLFPATALVLFVVTKNLKVGTSKSKYFFLAVPEAEKFRVKVLADPVSVRSVILVSKWLLSCFILPR